MQRSIAFEVVAELNFEKYFDPMRNNRQALQMQQGDSHPPKSFPISTGFAGNMIESVVNFDVVIGFPFR